jgi:hypothetical protein
MEDSPIQKLKLAPSQTAIGTPSQEIIIETPKNPQLSCPLKQLGALNGTITSITKITNSVSAEIEDMSSCQKTQQGKRDELKEGDLKKLAKWRQDKKFGDIIEGTNIMPCKVFLNDEKWLPHLETHEHFFIEDLLGHLHQKGIKLSLIVDLNRSFDYYNFSDAATKSSLLRETEYKKYILENAEVPTDEIVDEIYGILKDYHEQGKYVAIHCFNGINRTGYIVCDFLCRYFGMNADEAIQKFEQGRLHKIEHPSLVNKLRERYPTRDS